MYLVFTCMPSDRYCRRLRFLSLYLCYIFGALIKSLCVEFVQALWASFCFRSTTNSSCPNILFTYQLLKIRSYQGWSKCSTSIIYLQNEVLALICMLLTCLWTNCEDQEPIHSVSALVFSKCEQTDKVTPLSVVTNIPLLFPHIWVQG